MNKEIRNRQLNSSLKAYRDWGGGHQTGQVDDIHEAETHASQDNELLQPLHLQLPNKAPRYEGEEEINHHTND